jgi:pimeloyl-ACP methyl ester carboxylesterase
VQLDAPEIRREDFRVVTRDGIGLRARVVARVGLPANAPVVVLVHGIAAPLEPTYDLSVPGYSFLEELASRGLRAIAFDHRNFGKSDRDARLSQPPTPDPEGVGVQSLDDSVEDIRAIVQAGRERYGVAQLTLFGSSRGAIQSLATALHIPDALELCILNNPSALCYLSGATSGPTLEAMKAERDGARRGESYLLYTAEYQRKRWKKLFGDATAALVDEELQETYIAACIASDEEGSKRTPPVFRVPSEGFPTRVPLLPLGALAVPTLIVEAEEVDAAHVAAFFAAVPENRARLLFIRGSNHFTLRNARRFELANIIEAAIFGARATAK